MELRTTRWALLAAVVAGLAAGNAGCSRVEARPDPGQALAEATVLLENRCAGVLLAGETFVLTAAHCVQPFEDALLLTFWDGSAAIGQVQHRDPDSDLALLSLTQTPPARGLEVADGLAQPGTAGWFASRMDLGGVLQEIHVLRLGRCPSLPGVPQALFTSLRGKPGDSGAPVVDKDLRVIGLVHGGARCSIAAPTHDVPEVVRELEAMAGMR